MPDNHQPALPISIRIEQEDIVEIRPFQSLWVTLCGEEWHTEVFLRGIGPICSCGLGRELK